MEGNGVVRVIFQLQQQNKKQLQKFFISCTTMEMKNLVSKVVQLNDCKKRFVECCTIHSSTLQLIVIFPLQSN